MQPFLLLFCCFLCMEQNVMLSCGIKPEVETFGLCSISWDLDAGVITNKRLSRQLYFLKSVSKIYFYCTSFTSTASCGEALWLLRQWLKKKNHKNSLQNLSFSLTSTSVLSKNWFLLVFMYKGMQLLPMVWYDKNEWYNNILDGH